MRPLDRRKRLFSNNKPKFVLVTEENKERFLNWNWIAYTQSEKPELSETEFRNKAVRIFSTFHFMYSVEDYHKGFYNKIGPVGYAGCFYDGFNLKPHVEWYPWARGTTRLRCIVAFLTSMRSRRDVGMIWIESTDGGWLKLKKYIRIAKVGSVTKGRPDGQDIHIFYIRGSHGIFRKSIRIKNKHKSDTKQSDHPIHGGAVLSKHNDGKRLDTQH